MILVTGGAGFIGSHLAKALKGQDVVIVDNFHTGRKSNLDGFGGRVLKADSNGVASARLKPDIIFHLGIYSSSPMYLANHNLVGEVIAGTTSVFDLAAKCGSRVVYASTSSLYYGQELPYKETSGMRAAPSDFYTEARIAAERLADLYKDRFGVPSVGLRFFSVYGPGEESKGVYANMLTQFVWAATNKAIRIMGKKPTVYGTGSIERDFIHVDDIVEALKLAMRNGSGPTNVGTGKSYSFKEVMAKITAMTGEDVSKKVDFIPIPKNYLLKQVADTTKAEKELGFRARIDIDTGIRSLL